MPLKEAKGNMYDFVTNMHTHLGGECPHKCKYCYVGKNRFGRAERYKGEMRLLEHELNVDYGSGKIIFIEHMNDLFSNKVFPSWVLSVLEHCRKYDNEYVFQTKNPIRAFGYREDFPKKSMIGTTVETNFFYMDVMGATPDPSDRIIGMKMFKREGFKTFITIEPILEFDVDILSDLIISADPDFVNIGADSKRCGLPEPTKEKVLELAERLQQAGVVIRKKVNLERLTG